MKNTSLDLSRNWIGVLAFAFLSLGSISNSSAQSLPSFVAPDGTEWLVPSALSGNTWGAIQWTLAATGFRIATRTELNGLIGEEGDDATDAVELLRSLGAIQTECRNETTGMTFQRTGAAGIVNDGENEASPGPRYATVFSGSTVFYDSGRASIIYSSSSRIGAQGDCGVIWAVKKPRSFCGGASQVEDFDCDGQKDRVVWRPSTGIWYIQRTALLDVFAIQWGLPGDIPILGDYSGNGVTDLVVFRPSNGTWYVRSMETEDDVSVIQQQWGVAGDRPITGDYNGDGLSDFAIYRPSEGAHYWIRSPTKTQTKIDQWGLSNDILPMK